MRFGLISQVEVTPANTPDYKAVKNISPKQGMVFMDKGYDYKEADEWIKFNRPECTINHHTQNHTI